MLVRRHAYCVTLLEAGRVPVYPRLVSTTRTRNIIPSLFNFTNGKISVSSEQCRQASDARSRRFCPLRTGYIPDSVRKYATQAPNQTVKEVAVLGGGITGLVVTYYLTKEFPKAKITLFESKQELGGWVKSQKVDVGRGEVLFESGPRSLRPQAPNGTLTLRMIQELGLTKEVIVTPKSAPAAQNRFIFYPDHLVRMPGGQTSIFDVLRTIRTEPVFQGFWKAVWKDLFAPARSEQLLDESIGNFIRRRGDDRLANNLASALFHGIYAGDVWQLSAKTILALPWQREKKVRSIAFGGVGAGIFGVSWNFCDDVSLQMDLMETTWEPEFRDQIMGSSVYTFKNGLGQLAEAIEKRLKESSNVRIQRGVKITALEKETNSDLKISSTSAEDANSANKSTTYTHVVSTLPPATLTKLIPETILDANPSGVKSLTSIPAVTVCVVNLYYDIPSLLQKISPPGGIPSSLIQSGGLQGFGYLIPNSVPLSMNPERALGVIFDSDISPNLWSSVSPAALGTRLTVMLGGHYWDGWKAFPSATEAEEMARSVLERHLGIKEPPSAVRATLQSNCIPQYVVGHDLNMGQGHKFLSKAFGGRLRVAGSWYTGVGVNDCFRAAWDVVQGLGTKANSRQGNPKLEPRTGLERFAHGRPMVFTNRQKGGLEVLEIEQTGRDQDFFPGVKVE